MKHGATYSTQRQLLKQASPSTTAKLFSKRLSSRAEVCTPRHVGSYQPLQLACQGLAADAVLRAAPNVPHSMLLPRCCAVVHHGGAGTTAAALTAGTPQLVCPLHFDQFNWVRQPCVAPVNCPLDDMIALRHAPPSHKGLLICDLGVRQDRSPQQDCMATACVR